MSGIQAFFSNLRRPVSFVELVREASRVEIPLIQRDYAQGRESHRDVRDEFLGALCEALVHASDEPYRPLVLDFVYGGLDDAPERRFQPLDGQQRLTTLFLLHWYLAWCDGRSTDFEDSFVDGGRSRFSYGVRPSSTEFFDSIVQFWPARPPRAVLSLRRLIEDQPWFFSHWRLDPTVQGALAMLDALHARFRESTGLYERLVDESRAAVVFHMLPLEHFGLSDDLYIKMNARGKPLTQFETFKARLEELIRDLYPNQTRRVGDTELPVATFFERRMDTQWMELFWSRGPDSYDSAALNLVWAVVRISLDPGSATFSRDTSELAGRWIAATFTHFHERRWLTTRFLDGWMDLLEAWSSEGSALATQLPNTKFFDEKRLFERAVESPWGLTYSELLQFAAFTIYLTRYRDSVKEDELHQWMRVVTNLAVNSEIERPDEYGRGLSSIRELAADANRILDRLAGGEIRAIGFSTNQLREEALKAKLILSHGGWQERIETAETHGYFMGQIGFLLSFSGAAPQTISSVDTWPDETHRALQAQFDVYFSKACHTFVSTGLLESGRFSDHLWKRALLSIGDYLPSSGGNSSFCTDPPANWDSWKRFLRGGQEPKREFLKQLWDRLSPDADLAFQLEQVIATSRIVDDWRAATVKHPKVISYCGQQEIRREGSEEIYLLSRKQMSGYHAEIFSYVLHLELSADPTMISPLELGAYESVYGRDIEPRLWLRLSRAGCLALFSIHSENAQFVVQVQRSYLRELPEVEATLVGKMNFTETDGALRRSVPRAEVSSALREVARGLGDLPA